MINEIGWGKSVVEKLSTDLKKEFSIQTGFSAQSLLYMPRFYISYKDFPDMRQLVAEIPWGQNLVIMSRVKEGDMVQAGDKPLIVADFTGLIYQALFSLLICFL